MAFLARILAPVEFSERCEGAVRYARSLAGHFQSELTLLHVLFPPPPEMGTEAYQKVVAEAEWNLHAFEAEELAGLPVRRLAIKGDPARKIVQYAHDERIDLIVMPTRGFGPYRRFILGSNTAKVLHDADCPVCTGIHLDRPPAPRLPFRNILCAVDLGEQSKKALAFATELQQRFAARLTIAHAIPNAPMRTLAQKELEQLRKDCGAGAELLIEPGEAAPVIFQAARRVGADALVIGRGSAAGMLGRLRTNAYAIIRESPCPVFSV